MTDARTSLAALALLTAAGCASLRPTVDASARPRASVGYVAVVVRTSDEAWGFGDTRYGIGIVDAVTKEDYVFPLGEPSRALQASMIELPLGEYRVAYWVAYDAQTKRRTARKPIPSTHVLARPFAVSGGEVLVLGALDAEYSYLSRKVEFRATPLPSFTLSEARARVAARYPRFERAPTRCLSCTPAP